MLLIILPHLLLQKETLDSEIQSNHFLYLVSQYKNNKKHPIISNNTLSS